MVRPILKTLGGKPKLVSVFGRDWRTVSTSCGVYGTAAAGVAVQVKIEDNGCGMWVGKSFGNDPMLIATNEAFRYLSGLLHLRLHSQLPH
jgi:hypothetical protein